MQFALAFVVLVSSAMAASLTKDHLVISLYYESYCPGCEAYVEDEVLKAHEKFGDRIQLDLIPYGNAQQSFVDNHWVFTCQHGPKECLANKLHACAIDQSCGEGGSVSCAADKLDHVIKYIACVMKQRDQLKATAQCAKSSKLDADGIISCAKGSRGDELLSLYGNRTHAFTPASAGVPTIAFNGKADDAALDGLIKEICRVRPSLC